ncbi:MAG: endoribonuclease MazF [Terriglobales bacterium]
MSAYVPETAHIIKIDFEPHVGHEQGGRRPALVLSPKLYNGKTGMAVVVPITNQAKGYTFEVLLPVQIKTTGVIIADAIKSVDWRARRARYVEAAPLEVMDAVQERVMLLLEYKT